MPRFIRFVAGLALVMALLFLTQVGVEAGGVVPPRPSGGGTTTDDKSAHRTDRKHDTKHETKSVTHREAIHRDATTTTAIHRVATVRRKAYKTNDVAGSWDSDWGWMVLKTTREKGKKTLNVTGHWVQEVNKKGVITSGTYDTTTRTFQCNLFQSWNNVKGTARFTLAADGWSLKGTWKHDGGTGEWALKRVAGDDFKSQVDSLVTDAGVTHETPGCAVLVMERGKVLLDQGYGLVNLRDKKPITAQTTFEMASCSKQFTAAVIMRLHDEGKLSFDDNVRKYVPELPVYDAKHPIRIIHLLHHSSGLPQYGDFDYPKITGRKPDYVSNEDYAKEFARQRKKFPLKFAPGTKYEYNNGGYMLLALIAHRIEKKPFHEVIQEQLFKPLGMTHSWVYDSPKVHPKNPALGYGLDSSKKLVEVYGCPPYKNEWWLCVGGSGVWTCVEDMAKYDRAWRSGKFFKPATVEAATRPWKTADGQEQGYGFGWGVGHEGGKLTWMAHGGGGPSFCTTIYRNLAEDRTIVVLTNYHECELYWIRDGIERLCRARAVDTADGKKTSE